MAAPSPTRGLDPPSPVPVTSAPSAAWRHLSDDDDDHHHHHHHDDDHHHDDASSESRLSHLTLTPRPLSGPGASRHTRRLHLRHAAFRASALPSRNVTPPSPSSSSTAAPCASVTAPHAGANPADMENVSPSGVRAGSVRLDRRRSSGILHDIANTLPSRPRAPTPPKPHPSRRWHPADHHADTPCAADLLSPPPPRSSGTIRIKPAKTGARVGPRRRSVSGETRMYIEHLESELALAQSQLSAVTSPTVTREQSSKVRVLHAETRQLQQELADWEAKYEQRVQQERDRHHDIEAGLRAHIRQLEDAAEAMQDQLGDALARAATSAQDLEAVEAANVNLEKRLEIMSDLLAASPTKIDLHAETPGTRKRPRSMLRRFPTASSLVTSPVRELPVSPGFAFPELPPPRRRDTRQPRLAIDTDVSPSDLGSDVESVFSAAIDGDSMTSLEPESQFAYNAWTQHAVRSAKDRPSRRMRKFGAGCTGPRPLILPATAHSEYVPAHMPASSKGSPSTPYMRRRASTALIDDSPSSRPAHRRALTMADERPLAMHLASPFLHRPRSDDEPDQSLLSLQLPPSTSSQPRCPQSDSLGPTPARNLMDELSAIKTDATEPSAGDLSAAGSETRDSDDSDSALLLYGEVVEQGADVHSVLSVESHDALHNLHVSASPHDFPTWRPSTTANDTRLSIFQRFRLLFGDLWYSPAALARHLVHKAAARIRIPEPLRNVQWWLVGVLLGPMARRRMCNTHAHPPDDVESPPASEHTSLLASTPDDRALAYGTIAPDDDDPPPPIRPRPSPAKARNAPRPDVAAVLLLTTTTTPPAPASSPATTPGSGSNSPSRSPSPWASRSGTVPRRCCGTPPPADVGPQRGRRPRALVLLRRKCEGGRWGGDYFSCLVTYRYAG
ncbi:hypothetical protein Tdes44962_MAKER01739 [Teratosphaeria destructans]|uniref:Uncharacterized protein n=1 Tax=Teratosphaeria destructans TaxID=418781 RepID=A0A9W7W509_9PEZI|nr:hypothetical protein Tdes44962_MAKER01739 [Teratosphaeria destructans]